MKLENLLNIVETIESQKQEEQKLYDLKLEELKEYQKETENRKDKFREKYFPQKISDLIRRLTQNDSEITINCDNKPISIRMYLNTIVFSFVNLKKQLDINLYNNKYNEIFDWWANETYRKSHMVQRMNLLKSENELCDIVESNIESIYTEIAKRAEENRIKEQQQNINNLAKLNNTVDKPKANKTVKIIIEIVEE